MTDTQQCTCINQPEAAWIAHYNTKFDVTQAFLKKLPHVSWNKSLPYLLNPGVHP